MKKKTGTQEESKDSLLSMLMTEERPELRVTGIYGDVNEERCSEAVYGLHALHLTGKKQFLANPEDPESEVLETYEPIEFVGIDSWWYSSRHVFCL